MVNGGIFVCIATLTVLLSDGTDSCNIHDVSTCRYSDLANQDGYWWLTPIDDLEDYCSKMRTYLDCATSPEVFAGCSDKDTVPYRSKEKMWEAVCGTYKYAYVESQSCLQQQDMWDMFDECMESGDEGMDTCELLEEHVHCMKDKTMDPDYDVDGCNEEAYSLVTILTQEYISSDMEDGGCARMDLSELIEQIATTTIPPPTTTTTTTVATDTTVMIDNTTATFDEADVGSAKDHNSQIVMSFSKAGLVLGLLISLFIGRAVRS